MSYYQKVLPCLLLLATNITFAADPAVSQDPDMDGWTVDGFLKSMGRSDIKPVNTDNARTTSAEINEAVNRSVKQAPRSAYLDAIAAEADDLSVNTVEVSKDKELVRGAPVVGQVAYSENMIVVGGREIRDGYLTVKAGDTLSLIAADIYGDLLAYKKIFEANRSLLDDPYIVPEGTRLYIPID